MSDLPVNIADGTAGHSSGHNAANQRSNDLKNGLIFARGVNAPIGVGTGTVTYDLALASYFFTDLNENVTSVIINGKPTIEHDWIEGSIRFTNLSSTATYTVTFPASGAAYRYPGGGNVFTVAPFQYLEVAFKADWTRASVSAQIFS